MGFRSSLVLSLFMSFYAGAVDIVTQDSVLVKSGWIEYSSSTNRLPQCCNSPECHMVRISPGLLNRARESPEQRITMTDKDGRMSMIVSYNTELEGLVGRVYKRRGRVYFLQPLSKEERKAPPCYVARVANNMNTFHKLKLERTEDSDMPKFLFHTTLTMPTNINTCCSGTTCSKVGEVNMEVLKFSQEKLPKLYIPRHTLPSEDLSEVFSFSSTQPSFCKTSLCDIYFYHNSDQELLKVSVAGNIITAVLETEKDSQDMVLKECMGEYVWTERKAPQKESKIVHDYQEETDYLPNSHDVTVVRAAPGPACWYPKDYCNPLHHVFRYSSEEEKGRDRDDLVMECYHACQNQAQCRFFTYLSIRGTGTCYLLSDCKRTSERCLRLGTCKSGPSDCSPLPDTGECAPPPNLGSEYNKWQCINKETQKLGPVAQNTTLPPGTVCLQSCGAWKTEVKPDRPQTSGYLESRCEDSGNWSETAPFNEEVAALEFPKGPYPAPDATVNDPIPPLSCGCQPLLLDYNPNKEEGADFPCKIPINWNEGIINTGNECHLWCDGVLAISVKCSEDGWTGEPEEGFWCYEEPGLGQGDCICPANYDPVCGEDGVTYSNSCEAGCAEITVAAQGRCQGDCICPAHYDPVCGEDGMTYSNNCEAGCAEITVAAQGVCKVETRITIFENGETFVQENSWDSNTGTLTMNVPQHGDLLASTTVLNADPDTNSLRSNNTCQLTTLPDHLNLAEMAAGLGDVQTGGIYYIMNARESRVGIKEREELLQQARSQCAGLPIARTRSIPVSAEDFKSGSLILVNKTSNARMCSIKWEVCSSEGPRACGYGWINPDPNAPKDHISFHQVSSGSICVNCVIQEDIPGTTGCNVPPFDQYCLCSDIINKEKLMDCRLQGAEISVTITKDQPTKSLHSISTFYQIISYNNDYDRKAVSVYSPAHDTFVEMEVIMNARDTGHWHSYDLTNNRMIKIGKTCYIDTLPADHFPIDMAVGMQEIEAGNTTITPEDEVTRYSMLVNEGSVASGPLHELVKDSCQNSTIVQSREESITFEEFNELENGGVIFRDSSNPGTGTCTLQTAYTNISPKSGWRWPNSETGEQISVHSIVNPVEFLSCYINDDPPCPKDYCLCSDITDTQSFLECEPKLIFTATGLRGTDEYSADMTILDTSGNVLYSEDDSYTNLIPSINSIGAIFRGTTEMDETIFLCAGLVEVSGSQPPSQCYMYVKGAGFSPSFTLDGSFGSPGSSVVFTTEEGDFWWIIGENSLDVTTSLYFNLQLYTEDDYPPVLPKILNIPCITKVNNTFAFVTGTPLDESSSTNKAWLYDFGNNHWSSLEDTKEQRLGASCGVLDTTVGPVIFLAGGQSTGTTEYMIINDAVWNYGPTMLQPNFGGKMVDIQEELILTGGYNVDVNMQGFKPTIENNVLTEFSLRTDLKKMDPMIFSHVALTVPKRMFDDLLPPPVEEIMPQ